MRDPRIDPRPGDLVTVGRETRLVDGVHDGVVYYGWPGKIAMRNASLTDWRTWASRQHQPREVTPVSKIPEAGKTAPEAPPRAPLVSLTDIEAEIAAEYVFNAAQALPGTPVLPSVKLMTICILVLSNGFTVVGESACVSPENYDEATGRAVARRHAIDKVWPLLGFRLRDKLAAAGTSSTP